MEKVKLQVNGRDMFFSVEELNSIVEKHLSHRTKKVSKVKVAKIPTEGEWFEVKPQTIDQNLFKDERINPKQEETRQLILEAFAEMKHKPKKYGRNFKTMMIKKKWTSKTIRELKLIACIMRDHNANWIEQALEWAQRISNGESWESICNDADLSKYYRLVVWKNGKNKIIGGSIRAYDCGSASDISVEDYGEHYSLNYTVPLVVRYDK